MSIAPITTIELSAHSVTKVISRTVYRGEYAWTTITILCADEQCVTVTMFHNDHNNPLSWTHEGAIEGESGGSHE